VALQLITPPATEVVSLSDAKVHLECYVSDQDAYITLLTAAARRYAEAYCNRSFITQTWRLTLDSFPGRGIVGYAPFGQQRATAGNVLELERGTVQSITSIVYLDMAGATQTVTGPAAPDYALDLSAPLGRIAPGFGRIWPITLPQIGAVQITYVAGFGPSPTDVPEGLRHWIMLRTRTAFENREEVALTSKSTIQPLPYVDALLDEFSVRLA
jgi:uncharacterized phiE125 gp8 family phage protein